MSALDSTTRIDSVIAPERVRGISFVAMGSAPSAPVAATEHDIVETTERFKAERSRVVAAPQKDAPRDESAISDEAEARHTREVEKRVAELKAQAGLMETGPKRRCEAESTQLLECYRKNDGDVCAKYVQVYADCAASKRRHV